MRQKWFMLMLCVVASAITSLVTLWCFSDHDKPSTDVIRAKKIELTDQNGAVLGVFELAPSGNGKVRPRLVMRDADGGDAIDMEVDHEGRGSLSFASERWNVGAVILGHIEPFGDVASPQRTKSSLPPGAWGIRVRSPEGQFMTMGFDNSGAALIPSVEPTR